MSPVWYLADEKGVIIGEAGSHKQALAEVRDLFVDPQEALLAPGLYEFTSADGRVVQMGAEGVKEERGWHRASG